MKKRKEKKRVNFTFTEEGRRMREHDNDEARGRKSCRGRKGCRRGGVPSRVESEGRREVLGLGDGR